MAARKSEDTQTDDGLVTSDTAGRPSKATPIAPGDAERVEGVTGRPNDLRRDRPAPALANSTFADRAKSAESGKPVQPTGDPAAPGHNSTFAERAKAAKASVKRVAEAQNKAVNNDDAASK